MTARGTVINVHLHGATIRLDDGSLAAVPPGELAAHRPAYVASLQKRTALEVAVERAGRHRVAFLTSGAGEESRGLAGIDGPDGPPADDTEDGEIVRTLRLVDDDGPLASDPLFEHRIAAFLKSTEEWAPPDRPAPDERNEIRKKKRAAFFEARPPKRTQSPER